MEEPEAVATKESASTIPPPSSSSSKPQDDSLAKALQTLLLNVTSVVQGELQVANSEYELLERMNLRVASEHDHQAEFAQGLRVFVERLKQKNDGLSGCIHQIEEIDQEVTELEALVSTLDNYTTNLESKQWRQQLKRQLEEGLEDDECEEMMLGFMLAQTSDMPVKKHGGSRPGRSANLERQREVGHNRLFADYFSATAVHDDNAFRRRYRMRRGLFLRILEAICARDTYFVQRRDAAGVLGLSSIQKCTAALRMLLYGAAADATDEYCRLGESTAFESMKRFVKCVRASFESTYLRQPRKEDLRKQMKDNEARGFPGMFASIDCMHWRWKNCPAAWRGNFEDEEKNRSFILEAIVDRSLWIWHAFIGLPRDKHDVNLLDRSPIVSHMLKGEADEDLGFVVNENKYQRYYLLADEIYPAWSCFVQTIQEPQDEKELHFAEKHEEARRDVEKCFGMLQSRFAIIQNPCRQWHMDTVSDIMRACVIMHNMIIEDEAGCDLEVLFDHGPTTQMMRGLTFEDNTEGTEEFEIVEDQFDLRADLIEHLWTLRNCDFVLK